ncbi:GerAB/ArcD/ProY family transporter [Amphibacillus jilinensis]|uniref:GerAB/ArcD/ProY family transporter n=1 Tax=Amphibacillus jilinensis TaxID=1216008 RepID=UPI0002D2A860|nr:GerAB/ArcD/ProY family transporter [Amphibacillus jilinensis]
MKVDRRLTSFEMFTLTSILIGIKLTDTTPSLFSQKAQNAFWYIPLLAFICILPAFLVLLYLLYKHNAKHFVHLFELLLGQGLGKSLAFIIFILSFVMIALDSRNYVEQIKIIYFQRSSILIIFALFGGVCIFGAIRGIEVVGYTTRIFWPFIRISFFILAALIFESVVWQRIFPIFGAGVPVILEEGVSKGSLFLDFFLLTMAFSAFRKPSQFIKGGLIGLIFSIAEITFFFFLYTTVFDYNSIEKISFPFHEVTQYVNLGDFFTNIETFFMVFWLLATFLRFILLLYLITWLFGAIFNIDEFELLLLPMGFFLMVIGLLPDNAVVTELIYRNKLLNIITPVIALVPFLLLLIHFFKRKKDLT